MYHDTVPLNYHFDVKPFYWIAPTVTCAPIRFRHTTLLTFTSNYAVPLNVGKYKVFWRYSYLKKKQKNFEPISVMRTFGCYCTRSAYHVFHIYLKLLFTSLAITLYNKSRFTSQNCTWILTTICYHYLINVQKVYAKLKFLHFDDLANRAF